MLQARKKESLELCVPNETGSDLSETPDPDPSVLTSLLQYLAKNMVLLVQKFCGEFFFVRIRFRLLTKKREKKKFLFPLKLMYVYSL